MSKSAMNGKSKGQEESNLKVLRELTHLPLNRHCFDCGQRGPTYVNITIGSFICMTCSGLLRGLTPPHRVKSISMASFTVEEIEVLKSRGNEYCRKVWLATCTSKDSHLGPENDPDRVNSLKSFMSAKYEQKRYYIDPSKLSKSELTEIQAQTARALSSSSHSTNSLQKSPSLSSASSASSLTQQQNLNNPSPVMNNLRNNQHNRLVNSITLPDIKPLTSLIGPVSITANGTNISGASGEVIGTPGKIPGPTPIHFINNLSNPQTSKMNNSSSSSNHNSNNLSSNNGPWGGDNNFNANFADFDDAFNSNSNDNCNGGSASNNNANLFAPGLQKNGTVNGVNDINGTNSVVNNFATFNNSMQQPMLPTGTLGGVNQQAASVATFNATTTAVEEDRYAALKDLDSMFKQTFNGDTSGNGVTASSAQPNHGLANSTSLPANLSSSAAIPSSTGWFSTSPNQNPFSQAPNPIPPGGQTNGWNMNGINSGSGSNPHNPFFNNSWQSPLAGSTNATNSLFPTSQANFSSPLMSSLSQQAGISSSNASSVGTPSNNLFSHSQFNNHLNQVPLQGKVFNPFFGTPPTPASNPNNPFL